MWRPTNNQPTTHNVDTRDPTGSKNMEIYFITTSYSSQIYFIITSYMKYGWLWCRILDTGNSEANSKLMPFPWLRKCVNGSVDVGLEVKSNFKLGLLSWIWCYDAAFCQKNAISMNFFCKTKIEQKQSILGKRLHRSTKFKKADPT